MTSMEAAVGKESARVVAMTEIEREYHVPKAHAAQSTPAEVHGELAAMTTIQAQPAASSAVAG
ncbi:hypothetical protein CFL01nite_16760 [Corynebacterium flavescens]|uniref:ABC transporter ATP-binding protein n=1 Tax=Corynebacterium flavescens TaxID=28028 RepID=A0AB73B988_CORFL|nr:hypothetical protein CFL01nite_16760 [Corynebacterium flavescens]